MSTAALPEKLRHELQKMRRNAGEFTVLGKARCKFCANRKEAFALGHPKNPTNAGTWCPVHGWLFFDSTKIRPIGEQHIPKRRLKKAA